MTIITGIITESIETPLNNIVGVSVLPGYMIHYANDLLNSNNPVTFPAISFAPITDETTSQSGKAKLKNSRVMRLIGAVSVVDRTLVNSNLDSLLFAVRKALIVNNHDNPAALTKLEFGTAVFKLPDSQDQYAFFELDITISYVEVL